MKTLGQITLFAILIASVFLNTLLGAHVVLSIAELYKLTFITDFSFLQVFSFFTICGIFTFQYKKSENKDKTTGEIYKDAFTQVLSRTCYYLIAWGVSYVSFLILS